VNTNKGINQSYTSDIKQATKVQHTSDSQVKALPFMAAIASGVV